MDTSESLSIFTIDDRFMNQWFDSFDPSIKTFVANFVLNKMRHCDFEPDKMESSADKHFATLLANHFAAFLEQKMIAESSGRLIKGYCLLPSF